MGVLLLGVIARGLAYLSAGSDTSRFVTQDSPDYATLAYNFRAGYFDPESPLFAMGLFRTPLYPAFLALFLSPLKSSLGIAVMVQIGLSVLTIWLTLRLALLLTQGQKNAALLAALILAVDPVSALYPCLLQPETLFTLLLVGGVHLWVSATDREVRGTAFAGGLLLGLAALTRPIAVFLPMLIAPTAWLRRGRRSRGALALSFLAGAALPVFGWMAKNQVLIGAPVLTIIGDSSLLDYRAAGALARAEGISIEEARDRVWKRLWARTRPGDSVVALSRLQRAVAFEVLGENKWAAAQVTAEGLVRTFTGTGLSALAGLVPGAGPDVAQGKGLRPWQGLQVAILGVVYLAAIRAVFLMVHSRRFFELALLAGIVLYLVLLSAGPEAYTRFRFPAVPFLATLAGYGLVTRRAK